MEMTRDQWERLIAHAREQEPNECCGYLKLRDGVVEEVFSADNDRGSPYGYSLGFEALMAANELDDEGFEVGIYHSHPRSNAIPSQTDVNLAQYPTWRQLIVSLLGDEAREGPPIRCYWIAEGKYEEESIDVG